MGKKLSDVLLYLVRLYDICGIDIGKATLHKVDPNAIKYPVSMDPVFFFDAFPLDRRDSLFVYLSEKYDF